MTAFCQRIQKFALSEWYSLLVFLSAYACVILGFQDWGLCVIVLLALPVALFCDDVLPLLLPFSLIVLLALMNADQSEALPTIVYTLIPIVAVALIVPLLRARKRITLGKCFPGVVAVAAAILLGGLGSITAAEYFSSASLYHVLALGPLAVFVYLFVKAVANCPRDYDAADKISSIIYLSLIFVSFMILRIFTFPEIWAEGAKISMIVLKHAPWRNTTAAFVVMLLPFVFYYARRHHPVHLLSALFIYITAAISGSRGALICGGIQFLVCLFFFYLRGRERRGLRIFFLLALCAAAFAVYYFRAPIMEFCREYMRMSFDLEDILKEARVDLFLRGFEDFWACPIFGRGLGYEGNADLLNPNQLPVHIRWYHSLFPQIFGSLGLVGAAAYLYAFVLSVQTIFRAERGIFTKALVLSYFGILLYSQIDPGIFVPMPFMPLTVILFICLEAREKKAV